MIGRRHYILDGRQVVEADLLTWARWIEASREASRVAVTEVCGFRVSTVFLGLDHNFSGVGPPVLWETMVFQGSDSMVDWDQRRCAGSIEQAEEMHERVVREVEAVHGIEAKP